MRHMTFSENAALMDQLNYGENSADLCVTTREKSCRYMEVKLKGWVNRNII